MCVRYLALEKDSRFLPLVVYALSRSHQREMFLVRADREDRGTGLGRGRYVRYMALGKDRRFLPFALYPLPRACQKNDPRTS